MKKVKIYSTPTCPYCTMAKKYLSEKGVSYEDIDVSANPDKVSELVDASGQLGVPVIVVENEVIIGFDRPRLDQALAA